MLKKNFFYIYGKWTSPKNQKDIEVINPASEKACAVISLGSKDDVNDAVLSAKEAFKNRFMKDYLNPIKEFIKTSKNKKPEDEEELKKKEEEEEKKNEEEKGNLIPKI